MAPRCQVLGLKQDYNPSALYDYPILHYGHLRQSLCNSAETRTLDFKQN